MSTEPNKTESGINLDIIKHLEDLSAKVNGSMASRSRSVFGRYPTLFTLSVLIGAMAMSEGLKGLIVELDIFVGHPGYLFIFGLVVLILTGSLYKKLDK